MRPIYHTICIFLFLIGLTVVCAVPAPPVFTEKANHTLRIQGDEHKSAIIDNAGRQVVLGEDNTLYYEKKIGPFSYLSETPSSGNTTLTMQSHIPTVPFITRALSVLSSPSQYQKTPSVGTLRLLFIPANFDDLSFQPSHNESYLRALADNLTNYYTEASSGRLNLQIDIAEFVTLPKARSYYGYPEQFSIIDNTLHLADPTTDFTRYDSVMIVHAGPGEETSGNRYDYWSSYTGWTGSYLILDNKQFNSCTVVPEYEIGYGLTGVMAHELGHELGLPDLYNTNTGDPVVYDWDIMDIGSWSGYGYTPVLPGAWSKMQLGWADPFILNHSQVQQINSSQTRIGKIQSSTLENSNEFFLIENRQQVGYDTYIPEPGILIWHIDNDYSNNNGPIKKVIFEGTSYNNATFTADTTPEFSSSTNPSSNTNEGNDTGITLQSLTPSQQAMDIRLDIPSVYTYHLQPGWNLIHIPYVGDYSTASQLLAALPESTYASIYNSSNSNFITYIKTVPLNDFALDEVGGIFLYVQADTEFTLDGYFLDSFPVHQGLAVATVSDSTTTDAFCSLNPSTQYVSGYNSSSQQYFTHVCTTPVNSFRMKTSDAYFMYQ